MFLCQDWVSCCCRDFLASHQTRRQNCSNSLALSEIISRSCPAMLKPCFFHCTGALVSDRPRYLDHWATKPWSLLQCGRISWVLTTCASLAEERAIDFCSFSKTRKGSGCASAPRLSCFPKKEQDRFSAFQLLDPGASLGVRGLPDAVVWLSAECFCKVSLKCGKGSAVVICVSESAAGVSKGSRSEGLMELPQEQSLLFFRLSINLFS